MKTNTNHNTTTQTNNNIKKGDNEMKNTNKYFYESVGECVSQTQKITATDFDEALSKALDAGLSVGDIVAEFENDVEAEIENVQFGEYHSLDLDNAVQYATLCAGLWWGHDEDGNDIFRDDLRYWQYNGEYSDDPDIIDDIN